MEQDLKEQKEEFKKRVKEFEYHDPIDWGLIPLQEEVVLDEITDEIFDYITSIPKDQREIQLSIYMAKNMAEITALKIQQSLFMENHPKFYGQIYPQDSD
jgi:hypothetical protein